MVSSNKALLSAVALATIILMVMARPSVQASVYITNQLTKKVLIVHCRSKDGDLGAHAVANGSTIHWSFGPNLFGGTLFWCKLAVQNKRISFVAYDDDNVNTVSDWIVLDDGVYGRPYQRPTFLMAAWTRPNISTWISRDQESAFTS
ncbi:unnamed protein product [Linum tenue]|uniref:S-protein homolog n=1 Tax=Linum tenue TaxID=586396 RepID=A0AAV0IB34_9ROSI|nr:unnamed protein product [Linum tenue]